MTPMRIDKHQPRVCLVCREGKTPTPLGTDHNGTVEVLDTKQLAPKTSLRLCPLRDSYRLHGAVTSGLPGPTGVLLTPGTPQHLYPATVYYLAIRYLILVLGCLRVLRYDDFRPITASLFRRCIYRPSAARSRLCCDTIRELDKRIRGSDARSPGRSG